MTDTLSRRGGDEGGAVPPTPISPTTKDGRGTVRRFTSVESMLGALRPSYPVFCVHPDRLRAAARRFLDRFAGDVLYAVKCNPHRAILKHLYRAGIRHFDTASLGEVALVADLFDDATLHFNHPVKARPAILNAYRVYGVTNFVVDHPDELDKLSVATGGAPLTVMVRLATERGVAAYDLSAKFGADMDMAVALLRRAHAMGHRVGLCFHVGSQCLQPMAYGVALERIAQVVARANAPLACLDVGGGFPAPYEGAFTPPLNAYFEAIEAGAARLGLGANCRLMCEPGRALVAEGCSLAVQIQLRKDDALYINDGVYGSLSETVTGKLAFPARLIRLESQTSIRAAEETLPFTVFGPTCDSTDVLPQAVRLPADAREGDWIVFDAVGAYSNALATGFNGFLPETFVEIEEA